MKRKSIFIIGSALAASLLVGSTFAAWAITDKADPFEVGITPGTTISDDNDSVTLEWGTKNFLKVENLTYTEEKGPYEVGVKATTGSGQAFTGSLSLEFSWKTAAAPKLLDYLYVRAFAKLKTADDFDEDNDLLISLDNKDETRKDEVRIDVASGQEKLLYFYVGLEGITSPAQYDELKNDVVTVRVDWGKTSDTEEITSRTYYFNNNATNWNEVYAYAWKDSPSEVNTEWPGVKMTKVKGEIYSIELPIKYDKIIFNNGSTAQTDDLTVDADKPYYNGSEWVAAPSEDELADAVYYLVGSFNEWKTDADLVFAATEDENILAISSFTVEEATEVKAVNPLLGDAGWYGVDHVYDNCGYTVGGDGNAAIEAGTYRVELYLNSQDGNYLKFIARS